MSNGLEWLGSKVDRTGQIGTESTGSIPRLFDKRLAISVDELAAALGITPNAVYLLVARRKIPSRKVGRRRMFDPQEIAAWLRKKRSQ